MGKTSQKRWIEKVEKRLSVISSMLGDIKAVKMLGLTDKMFDIIDRLQRIEVETSMRFRKIFIAQVFFCKYCSSWPRRCPCPRDQIRLLTPYESQRTIRPSAYCHLCPLRRYLPCQERRYTSCFAGVHVAFAHLSSHSICTDVHSVNPFHDSVFCLF